jgi:hypothetical protein
VVESLDRCIHYWRDRSLNTCVQYRKLKAAEQAVRPFRKRLNMSSVGDIDFNEMSSAAQRLRYCMSGAPIDVSNEYRRPVIDQSFRDREADAVRSAGYDSALAHQDDLGALSRFPKSET